jgi:hypothetical protein
MRIIRPKSWSRVRDEALKAKRAFATASFLFECVSLHTVKIKIEESLHHEATTWGDRH